ncbi:unnamed protein product [Brassica oleracea]
MVWTLTKLKSRRRFPQVKINKAVRKRLHFDQIRHRQSSTYSDSEKFC